MSGIRDDSGTPGRRLPCRTFGRLSHEAASKEPLRTRDLSVMSAKRRHAAALAETPPSDPRPWRGHAERIPPRRTFSLRMDGTFRRRPSTRRVLSWGLVLSALLASSPAWAFRSGRDLSELSSTERVHFVSPSIGLQLQADIPAELSISAVDQTIKQALATWAAPNCSGVPFSYDGLTLIHAAPGDGINTIEWVRDWESRGFPADAAGATDVQYVRLAGGDWSIAEADVYLNAEFAWTTDVPRSSVERDVLSVMTHEAGHVLGLLHPCEVGGAGGAPYCTASFLDATMYPIYSVGEATLAQDDIDGVCFLYERRSCAETGCPQGKACTPDGCRAQCGDEICAAETVCTPKGCRRPDECTRPSCAGAACGSDDDCGSLDRCLNGLCAQKGAVGARCSETADCLVGTCLDGVCTRSCASDGECGARGACDQATATCRPTGLGFGAACQAATECASGVCLEGAALSPVCSQACGESLPACPGGWACDSVGGKAVCAPVSIGGGCSTAVARPHVARFAAISLMAALAAAYRRRRKARS